MEFNLAANIGQSISVIDIAATWCGPCVNAITPFEEMAAANTDPRVKFYVGLVDKTDYSCEEWGQNPTDTSVHNKTNTILFDGDSDIMDIRGQIPVTAYPTYAFINEKSEYMGSLTGFNANDVQSVINTLLGAFKGSYPADPEVVRQWFNEAGCCGNSNCKLTYMANSEVTFSS